MFKKVTLTIVSLFVLASTVTADDDLLNELASTKGANIADSSIEIEEVGLDIDVDSLSENADGEEDAVEACFRRFGYRSWGHSYGYRCFRPYYNCYNVYRPYICQPVYNYCRPIVSYWGCF